MNGSKNEWMVQSQRPLEPQNGKGPQQQQQQQQQPNQKHHAPSNEQVRVGDDRKACF